MFTLLFKIDKYFIKYKTQHISFIFLIKNNKYLA